MSKEKAISIINALEPDNVNFPNGLSFHVENVDDRLILNFECKSDLKKIASIIDEVLNHIQVVLKVIK